MSTNGFMDYMSYRNTVVEDKIEECLSEVRSGASHISIDRGDLTDDEVEYLKREVEKRSGMEVE